MLHHSNGSHFRRPTASTSRTIRVLGLAALMVMGVASLGCETSHTETTKQGILGGTTHEETTTTHNPVTGQDSVNHTETQTP